MFKNSMSKGSKIALMVAVVLGNFAKAEEFLQEHPEEAAKTLGQFWLTASPYLTKEETKTLQDIISKGLKRQHQAALKKEAEQQAGKN